MNAFSIDRALAARPPVIIIGMHRSGTTLITSLLQKIGLFVGAKTDDNHESPFFCGINEWLLHQSGGAWDHPLPLRHLLAHDEVRELTLDYLRYLLGSPRLASYLGWKRVIAAALRDDAGFAWGWKDPRASFTLPLWLELFPEAKVVHVCRHGVDVAASILVRQKKMLANYRGIYQRRKPLYWLRPKRGGFAGTLRCASLEGGFSLWEEYLEESRRQVAALGERALEVRYEDFLASPAEGLAKLASFCGLPQDGRAIREAARTVRQSRALAYLEDPEAARYASRVQPRLERFGY